MSWYENWARHTLYAAFAVFLKIAKELTQVSGGNVYGDGNASHCQSWGWFLLKFAKAREWLS